MADERIPSTDPAPSSPGGRVIDRRTLPLGVVPRHLQQWVLIGIVIVMVGILALSGPPAPSRTPAASSPSATAVDPNQERIKDYQRRIQEQTQRLIAEQAALQNTKAALTAASDQSQPPTFRASVQEPSAQEPSTPDPSSPATPMPSEPGATDPRLRVADNVAFSRPREHAATAATSVAAAKLTEPAAPFAISLPPLSPPPPAALATTSPAAPASDTPPAAPASPRPVTPVPPIASGEPRYRLYEGTVIDTVLTNRLDGTFNGPVNCLVSVPVYADDHVVIPAGARALGEARAVNTFGQTRLAVVFHRVILPNGQHIDLDDFRGLNQVGDLGLRDQVNHHYAQIFGVSLALGAIAGFAQGQTAVGVDATALDAYRQGAAATVSQSSTRVLDRFLNILPTVTIREGHRIKVYLSNDLELPAYRPAPGFTGGNP